MKDDKFISESLNEYFDVKDEIEEAEEEQYFPVQSMIIENEWISSEEHRQMKSTEESPYFGNVKINFDERLRFISPLQQPTNNESPKLSPETSPKINRSILNELLPTQVQLEQVEEESSSVWINDKIYGQVFKGCLIIWFLWSFLLISSKPATNSSDNMAEVTGWFSCCLILGLALSVVWAKILAEQTGAVVYGLIIAVPTGFAVLSLLSFSHFYILTGSGFAIISAVLSLAIYLNRKTMRTTVDIIHSAAIFIQATPKVYGLVMKIVAGYFFYILIWLSAFSRLFNYKNWTFMIVSQISFIFMLIWFGSVLSTVQKFLISTWVRAWMNKTDDFEKNEAKLMNEKSFGTICLAAGLLTAAKMTRLIGKGTEFTVKTLTKFTPGGGIISSFFSWILSLISTAERMMQRFNDFVIYYLAVSETEGFLNSCRGLSQAIDGHLGLALTVDSTAQLLLMFSTILISLISTALILFLFKAHINYYSSILIGLLSASVMDFVSNTYTSAIDVTFLCYVMDLKRADRKIDNQIHEAFSSKLSAV